jgi:glutamate-1-semialdehyde 2,1-aminomutase
VPVVIPRVGSLLGIFFTDTAPTNFDEASAAAENGRYRTFFHGMLERGIAFAPGPYEAIFVSTVHTDEVIDQTIAAAAEVAASMV